MDQKKQLESLLTASQVLLAPLELGDLLRKMMDLISEVMESGNGAFYLLDPESGELMLEMMQDVSFMRQKGLTVKRAEGALSLSMAEGVPVLIEDAKKDPRYRSDKPDSAPHSVLCVPMECRGKRIGVVEVTDKKGGVPFDLDDLTLFQGLANLCAAAIVNAGKFTQLSMENRRLRERFGEGQVSLVGNSPAIRRILSVVKKVAPTDSIVLITGDSGTGKEVIARSIHALSRRSAAPFFPVNCGALPETLLESELFGHEKGAFTGADRARAGLFEEAKGGTVFLDEIGETTLSTQVKLLRVLQEGKIKRVGSNREVTVDARILSATNRKLEDLILEKKFREDLYYRLNVVNILVPPLSERPDDLPLLLDYFLKKACEKTGHTLAGFTQAAQRCLYTHEWKGNVRELENAVLSAVSMGDGPYLDVNDLPVSLREGPEREGVLADWSAMNFEDANADFEKAYFGRLLERCDNDTSLAAEKAGISEKSVLRRRSRFGL
ncbi:MAG: sigma-54-dependent Fis family transcriptional regulator [Fibrobacterota bacterium]